MLKTRRQRPTDQGHSGQALVEFALVMPILMLLVMALFDMALMFNAYVGVNRASQHAAHLAATLGPNADEDCRILTQIESDVTAPNDADRIELVRIGRTSLNGDRFYRSQVYDRDDSGTHCGLPYKRTASDYPAVMRCSALNGCDITLPDGTKEHRTTVDNIGVSVVYRHKWATPLNAVYDFFGGRDTGWLFDQRNIFRMEPTQ